MPKHCLERHGERIVQRVHSRQAVVAHYQVIWLHLPQAQHTLVDAGALMRGCTHSRACRSLFWKLTCSYMTMTAHGGKRTAYWKVWDTRCTLSSMAARVSLLYSLNCRSRVPAGGMTSSSATYASMDR